MKIAVVGMGAAGSYLTSRLRGEHRVVGYERLSKENFESVCAWGTPRYAIEELLDECGVDFEDYILHEGREMTVDLGDEKRVIKLRGLCVFDKVRLLRDLVEGDEIHYGHFIREPPGGEDFDLIIDATGVARPLLPQVKRDILIPCVQYRVKYSDPPFDDFYIKPFRGLSGYLWYFPMDGGRAHVGAGDYFKRHTLELENFLKRYPCEVIKKMGRPVRVTPPSLCQPFYQGRVVGVGEAIGTVYPILGEGIVPSLQCAQILLESLENLPRYRERVLKKFSPYNVLFHFIQGEIQGTASWASRFLDLLTIYLHMKRREKRFGLEVRARDVFRIAAR